MKRLIVILMMCAFVCVPANSFPAPAEKVKKKLVIALHAESDTFDLSSTKMLPLAELVAANISEKLVGITPSGKLIPGLATWKISPDGKEIEFTLRKGIKFHSADPLTTKDVEFSYKRGLEKNIAFPRQMALVEKLEVIDDYRIKFRFKQPDATFLPRLAVAYIVSKSYYDRVGEEKFVKQPVGTGPYKFVNWVLGEHINLEANEGYWGGPLSIKEVRFDIVKEGTTRVAKLRTGEADLAVEIPFPMVKELEKAGFKTVKIPAHPSLSLQFQTLNPNVPWYDKRVRLACALAIDGKAIVEKLFHGVTDHFAALAPWELGYDPDLKPYPFDPGRAKKLLAEAGYPQGFEMPLYYQIGRISGVKEAVEAVTLYLNAIGVKCKVMGIEPVQFMEKIRYSWHNNPKGEYVGVTGPPICQYPDPTIALEDGFSSRSFISLYSNPEFDELLVKMRSTLDDTKRGDLIKKAVRILHEDVPTVLISGHKMLYAMGKHVEFTPTIKTQYPLMLIKDVKFVD
jgi:peptide/nickel transport system substrate-binding protein